MISSLDLKLYSRINVRSRRKEDYDCVGSDVIPTASHDLLRKTYISSPISSQQDIEIQSTADLAASVLLGSPFTVSFERDRVAGIGFSWQPGPVV
jgi:hypothetical protein